jgi:hypothetical protein
LADGKVRGGCLLPLFGEAPPDMFASLCEGPMSLQIAFFYIFSTMLHILMFDQQIPEIRFAQAKTLRTMLIFSHLTS